MNYIEDCLRGFLMQKVDFNFEVLIHDDASTDGTREVIKTYQEKYPEIIKPIFQTENQYSRGHRGFNSAYNYPRAQGIYIALCDGDDYWTDPLKLQKQIDFLENNPDYVVTYHDCMVVKNIEKEKTPSPLTDLDKSDSTAEDLMLSRKFIKTLTLCFRNVVKDLPDEMKFVKNGDTFLISYLGNFGKGKWMGDKIEPGIYRVHGGGVWSLMNLKQRYINSATTNYWLFQYYNRIEKTDISKLWFNNLVEFLGIAEKEAYGIDKSKFELYRENERELHRIKNSIPYKLGRLITSPVRAIKRLIK